jgi:hypothetical protein
MRVATSQCTERKGYIDGGGKPMHEEAREEIHEKESNCSHEYSAKTRWSEESLCLMYERIESLLFVRDLHD